LIENVDTEPIDIYEIEDWLPNTGSTLSSEGFIYVDDSATGRIIGRPSYPVLFYDGFSRADSNNTGWTETESSASYCRISSYEVNLRGNGSSITKSAISTANQTGIQFSYYWTGRNACEWPEDKLDVYWKPHSSGTWTKLVTHNPDTETWSLQAWNLPSSADNTTIDIRFTATTNDPNNEYIRIEYVWIKSNVATTDTPVCMPDDNFGTDFKSETWEYVYPYFQYRWSINWDFSHYPLEEDSVWDQQGCCSLYPINDYNPTLQLQPGEILEIVFQAQGSLTYSGSYFNEVFVKINEDWGSHGEDEWLYSWPTGTIIVPQYDLEATTLSEILRANALLSPDGHWWRSWHWHRRR
jgi:hypothetical protein